MPIKWLQDNIFYTDEKTKEINEAMWRNAGVENEEMRKKRREGVGLKGPSGKGNQNRSGVEPIDGSYRKGVEAGPDGKVTYGSLPPSINTRDVPPPSGGDGNRKGTRTSPPSTPIDMSRGFDSMLVEMGLGQYATRPAFSSNQLPTTAGSPDRGHGPVADGAEYAKMVERAYGNKETGGTGGSNSPGYKVIQPTDPIHAEAFGQDLTDQRIADGNSKSTGYTKGGRLDQALAGVKTQEANREMTPERRRAMASMAFYSADNAMDGLKARDAANQVIYAGGQHWGRGALTEDSPYGDKYKIDRDHARDIASGKTTAVDLLQTYKDRLKSSKPETPAESQDPLTPAAKMVKDNFKSAQETDFKLNNEDTTPSPGTGPVVPPDIIENYDFSKPGAEEAYFKPGGILDQHTKRK